MQLVYFAWVREKLNRDSEEIELPDTVTNITELLSHLAGKNDQYARVFENPTGLKAAKNDELVALDCSISNEDKIAIFPPMTGG